MDPQFSEDEDVSNKFNWQEPRKEPLGATKESLCEEECNDLRQSSDVMQSSEDHETLSSSVFSLTSHLAQVEFRLRQILKAPLDEKDSMLKALEEFTSRGALDARATPWESTDEPNNCHECAQLEKKMHHQRSRQTYFVNKLKSQLKELEMYNSEGTDCRNSKVKQIALIEHLRDDLNRSMEESWHQPLSVDELRHQINCAIKQFAERQLSKDEIISKLQAHINDMQKFIQLMKNEDLKDLKNNRVDSQATSSENKPKTSSTNEDLKAETLNLMRKASTLIQIFTVWQFGCSSKADAKRYERTNSVHITHWGNLRAKLEISIESVLNLVKREGSHKNQIDSYDSDGDEIVMSDAPLTRSVRRHLAPNLRDLLHHGILSPESQSVVPLIGCFPGWRSSSTKDIHFWDLILKYYDMNDGDAFNSTPARKLSASFNLDIVGGSAVSNKQSLLSTISTIINTHRPYKRSQDAQFKAFVCAGLNSHKLVAWLNTILKCRALVDMHYSSISYVTNTGFQDALQSLDCLTPYKFDLPVDFAVKQFQNIKDAFM